MDTLIQKLIQSFNKRGLTKQASILEEFIQEIPQEEIITPCPICGDEPEIECLLCDGTGILISTTPNDEEDERVQEELKIKE
jgi:hypothetical protein